MVKIRYHAIDIFLCLILIPFLYPRGFSEYFPLFKTFFDLWLVAAMALILLLLIHQAIRGRLVLRPCLFFILLYYGLFIGITLGLQGGVNEGIQKLFVAPVLCLFCVFGLEDHKKSFLRCVSGIMIVNFILNLTVFHPLFFPSYFAEELHILFLGHIQVVAPLGILGMYVGYLLYRTEGQSKFQAILLITLSVINMLYSRTSASIIVLAILGVGLILVHVLKLRGIFCLAPRVYVWAYFALNFILIRFAAVYQSLTHPFFKRILFNGRVFIWGSALELIEKQPIFGYGAYGVLLKMFWHAPDEGMNYSHNEILQRLMDGGILLLIAFCLLLFAYVKPIQRLKENKGFMCVANLFLITMLFVMIFEALTEYYYIFIFLSLLAFSPEFSAVFSKKKERISKGRTKKT